MRFNLQDIPDHMVKFEKWSEIEIEEQEIWDIAREYEQIPIFENIYMSILEQNLKIKLDMMSDSLNDFSSLLDSVSEKTIEEHLEKINGEMIYIDINCIASIIYFNNTPVDNPEEIIHLISKDILEQQSLNNNNELEEVKEMDQPYKPTSNYKP